MHRTDEVVRIGEQITGRELTDPVLLEDHPGEANTIVRCRIGGSEETLIVKRSNRQTGTLFREAAALRFLDEIDGLVGLAPCLYASDRETETLVIEDLGPDEGQLLAHLTSGDDPALAEAALIAHQVATARLHGLTAGREDEFARIVDELGGRARSRHRVHRIPEALAEMPDHVAAAWRPLPEEVLRELELATSAIENPGPLLVLTHGDNTFANASYTDGRIRLFDFETADFRHALLDGSFSRLRYLHSMWALELPRTVRFRMLSAYRNELSEHIPLAWDDQRFDQALSACSLGWLAGLLTFLPRVAEKDVMWTASTFRQRIVAALEHFAHLSAELQRFKATGRWTADFASELRSRWPAEDCTLPPCPAFASSVSPY